MKFTTVDGLEICAVNKRAAALILRESRIVLDPLPEELELTCIDNEVEK